MRIPFSRFGLPQVIMLPAIITAIMMLCLLTGLVFAPVWLLVSIQILLAALLVVSFAVGAFATNLILDWLRR